MKLYIDTSNRENKLIRLGDTEKRFSGDTLVALEELLKQEGKSLHDLTEIEVNSGPGGFTSLREGIVITNTLNYVLGLKSVKEMTHPQYGQEPNITRPKPPR